MLLSQEFSHHLIQSKQSFAGLWLLHVPCKTYKKYFPNRKCPLHSSIIQVSSNQISHYPLTNLALETDIEITPSPFSHLVWLLLLFSNKIIGTEGSWRSSLHPYLSRIWNIRRGWHIFFLKDWRQVIFYGKIQNAKYESSSHARFVSHRRNVFYY